MLPSVDDAICPMSTGWAHTLPSGRAAELCDTLVETQPFTSVTGWWCGWWCRIFRGRRPRAGMPITTGFVEKSACPKRGDGSAPARIIVQLMAEPFIRGEPAPGITQSIEAYTVQGDVCIWELL
jgi:hypothetical protein